MMTKCKWHCKYYNILCNGTGDENIDIQNEDYEEECLKGHTHDFLYDDDECLDFEEKELDKGTKEAMKNLFGHEI